MVKKGLIIGGSVMGLGIAGAIAAMLMARKKAEGDIDIMPSSDYIPDVGGEEIEDEPEPTRILSKHGTTLFNQLSAWYIKELPWSNRIFVVISNPDGTETWTRTRW